MLATALAPVIGYDEAAKLAKEAFKSGTDDPRAGPRARDGPGRPRPAARPGRDDRTRARRRTLPAADPPAPAPRRGPRLTRPAPPGPPDPRSALVRSGDDLHPSLGSRRCPARAGGWPARRGGRRTAGRPAHRRRAVRLHARCRDPLRDPADADRGSDLDGARRGHDDPRRRCSATPARPGSPRACRARRSAARTRSGSPTANLSGPTPVRTRSGRSDRRGTGRAAWTTRTSRAPRWSTSR